MNNQISQFAQGSINQNNCIVDCSNIKNAGCVCIWDDLNDLSNNLPRDTHAALKKHNCTTAIYCLGKPNGIFKCGETVIYDSSIHSDKLVQVDLSEDVSTSSGTSTKTST
ncbi:hypothetical protein BB559_005149 [Furculomyces boomerangus]|uniref:Uncharacterized protein n=2 Tax=Harpellales TaxID=61421 RepID=A0A2T9YAF3_9FUNG|nr:hypothetical protein BB559_005149 [Furculomyces boomerangus]PVZ97724.1 hypothetical protein BB558_006308 [Smittium angustum]